MTTDALTTTVPDVVLDAATIERALIGGDLKPIPPAQRTALVIRVCESLGLNHWTQPFAYIEAEGKITLYAKKDCTDQLRKLHDVSVVDVRDQTIGDLYKVTTRVQLPSGRQDVATGVVAIVGLRGQALANALMKAETKSKRRATLSICGLGMLDESEIDDIDPPSVSDAPPAPIVRRSEKFAAAAVVVPGDRVGTTAETEWRERDDATLERNAAEPAPTPATPANDNAGILEHLIITDTEYQTPKGIDPYWEIKTRVDLAGATPFAYVFLTRDESIGKLAEQKAGTPTLFAVTWKRGKRPDGSPCKIVEEMAITG